MRKVMATIAAGALMVTLAGCGNSSSSAKSSSNSTESSSKVIKSAKTSNKAAATSEKQSNKEATSSSSVSSNTNNAETTKSSSTVTAEQNNTRAEMTAQDAKNIVKEHIGNQLNNAGISGKPAVGLPTIDEVDGYTAVKNGVNDWTVSGNGHSFHVTATSVTGK